MHATACPRCGSKRTTDITPAAGKPAAVWCHQCGAVTDRLRDDSQPHADDEVAAYAIWVPKGA